MTVYNEADFIEYAIKSCLPYVDHLVIVEGAYQETIALGKSARSTDGTIDKIASFSTLLRQEFGHNSFILKNGQADFHYLEANEKTDKDQRNVGLEKIKQINPDGYCLIVDGDEIYSPDTFQMIKVAMKNMERTNKYGAYFKSLTFVNDMKHFTEQDFPRLFKITPECKFVDDNFMSWPDKSATWNLRSVLKIPYISYHHMSFVKGTERFNTKRDWWMSRGLGEDFDYGWKVDESGKITDENHEIHEFTGKLPEILKTHPLYPKEEEKKDET
jgi:glycosyltransferase involved in cell wall biosynthesis